MIEISTPCLTLIKDLALGVVGQLYEYFLNRYDMASCHLSNLKFTLAKHKYQSFYQICIYCNIRSKKHMTVIIGTSGDTGSAAISALRGLEWVDTVVLLPHGRCTMIQELQMTTVLGKYISRKL